MKTHITFITFVLLIISQGILSPVSAQWFPYVIDSTAGTLHTRMVADMDGDGDIDIPAAIYTEGKILWYENDNFTWTKYLIREGFDGPISPYPADIDSDGTLDIVLQGNGIHRVSWFENNHPIWTEHIIDPNLRGAEYLDVADIDNDGDLDVAAVGWIANDVVWYKNNLPDTIWSKYTIDHNLRGATTIAVADIDNDDDLDVVATGSEADVVVWYKNNLPDTEWDKFFIDSDIDRPWEIAAADIDSDGDMDIAVPGRNEGVLNWYENHLSDSVWTEHTIDDDLVEPSGCRIADIDDDNKPDIISYLPGSPELKWYKNEYPNWEERIIDVGYRSASAEIGDIDGDGLLDILANDGGTGIYKWYHNQPNVAQVKTMQSSPRVFPQEGDTLYISSRIYNPQDHQVSVLARIYGDQSVFTDSIQLYDDGQHNDSLALDNIYGNSKWLSGLDEDIYTIEVSSHDLIEDIHYILPSTTSFTTLGPLVAESVTDGKFRSFFNPNLASFDVIIRNLGEVTTAKDISAWIFPDITHPCLKSTGQSYKKFGDIEPGQTAEARFSMEIEDDCLNDSVITIPFTIEIESKGVVYWIDNNDIPVGVEEIKRDIPFTFNLEQNYPNPFNPTTAIGYQLSAVSDVELNIYNLAGQKVAILVSEKQNAGHHHVEWDASGFASGVYYYRLEAGAFVDVKKMVLIR